MASLRKEAGKRWILQFQGLDNRRRTIRLGTLPKSAAESVKFHVEQIVSAAGANHGMPLQTPTWLAGLGDAMHEKLAAVGLAESRKPTEQRPGLAAFVDQYIDQRREAMKPATLIVWGHVRRNLVDYFGAEKDLREVTPGDADNWRLWLAAHEALAENTIRKRCQFAKQFFRSAIRHRLITENPFAEIKGKVQANPTREYFVTREEIAKVLDACPDSQWRLIIALSRFGGMRCPSEHLALTWGDVDWERDRMRITSPKTEHHEGKAERWMPIFPELRPYLQASLDELLEDFDPEANQLSQQPVIFRYREAAQNLGTQFARIQHKARVARWPKAFQNMRATRETELTEHFPLHVVCAWIGNSQAIAKKHYLQVTDEHFARAAAGKSALQNPTHSSPEMVRNASQNAALPEMESAVSAGFPGKSSLSAPLLVEDRGLEPLTS